MTNVNSKKSCVTIILFFSFFSLSFVAGDCSLIFYESFESEVGVTENTGLYSDTEIVQQGKNDKGILIDGEDTLSYSRDNNLDLEKGSIEMWVKPEWDGNDNERHFFFHYWVSDEAMLALLKGESDNELAFYMYHNKAGDPDDAIEYVIDDWNAGEWHHVAATWRTDTSNSDFLKLYIDKELVAELTGQDFPSLNSSSELFKIGHEDYGWTQQARADSVIDELRIFDYVIDYEQAQPGFDDSFDGYPFGAVPASIISEMSLLDFSLAEEVGIKRTKGDLSWGDIEKTKGVYSWDDDTSGIHGGLFDTNILNAQSKNIIMDHLTIGARKPYYLDCKDPLCPSEESPTAEVGCLYEDKNKNDFKRFVYNAVERYDGDGICDMPGLQEGIRYWRFGTEMGERTWCGTGEEFLVVYEDIYDAVKSADTNAKLIFGGLHGGIFGCVVDHECSDWIRDNAWYGVELFDYIYSNIDSEHVDAFGTHPYDKWYQNPGKIDAMNNYLAGKGLDNKQLWVIEEGEILEHEVINAKSDQRQAEEVIKRFVISMSRGIEHIYWFDLYWYHGCLNVDCSCALGEPVGGCEPAPCCYGQDDSGKYVNCPMLEQCEECAFAGYHCYGPYNDPCGETCIGTKNSNHENMALLEYDEFESPPETNKYKKRPGFYTYKLMTEKLGGYDSVEVISENLATYYGYKFLVDGKPVWALWTNGPTYELSLDTGTDVLVSHIITERGSTEPTEQIIPNSAGSVLLSLNETPIFVEEILLVCGDDMCEGGETCDSCSIDCQQVHVSDDSPCNGEVSLAELVSHIDRWETGSVGMDDLMDAIGIWKAER
ncbi:LamG domain-containing protein [archaeon]|nr:LamG domain-containing protein [archaeon]